MRRLSALLLVTLISGLASPVPAQTTPPLLPPDGLTDPTLALGLTGVADYGTARPFVDQMLTARPWFAAVEGEWGTMSADDLIAGGYVDDEGWVTRMPPGMQFIRTIWAYPERTATERAGTYILTYEGEGSIRMSGDARRIDARPGRIIFATEGRPIWLEITEIDPRGVGRPIRNISIVQDKDIPLYEAGVVFRPEWVDMIKDARVLRFMDWAETNGSRVQPGESPLIEARGFWRMKGRGVPLSLMVDLANSVGADPWFNMPHQADDDYVRRYAEYVRDRLDPALKAHVEYSNEVWNEAFPQGRWVREQAAAEWGLPYGHEGGIAFMAREATRDALIWEDVFGSEATTRLDNVLATQTVNAWATGLLLDPQPWIKADPATYLPASAVFDSLAVTTYFSGQFISQPELRDEMIRRIAADPAGAARWITAILSDPEAPDTPLSNRAVLTEMKRFATENGLKLVAYEGGQHILHAFAVPGLTEEQIQAFTDFLIAYIRGPDLARITAMNWDAWREFGDGPYMHFGDVGLASKWGSFSLFDAPGLSNPTADLLRERNRSTPSWWGESGGIRYQQGLLLRGNHRDNALSGTVRSDILLGDAGNDVLVPGPGSDHLNGGDGSDAALLPDPSASVTVTTDGPRTVARGPSGQWTMFSVERLRFADGKETTLPAP